MKSQLTKIIDWDVLETPMKVEKRTVPNVKTLLRNDNMEFLSVMSNQYNVFSNSEFMKLTGLITEQGEYMLEGYDEFKKGRSVLAFLRNTSTENDFNGYNVDEFLVLGNTHDGSHQFYVGSSSRLVRCSNQFSHSISVLKKKHIDPIVADEQLANTIIQTYSKGQSSIKQKMEQFKQKEASTEIINQLINQIMINLRLDSTSDIPKDFPYNRQRDIIIRQSIEKETSELGMNLFGLFNGITWYTSHEIPTVRSHYGATSGIAKKINDIAYRYCDSVISPDPF